MFVKEETRQLARVVQIDDLKPIQKADRLEIAVVGGWECVVKKGLYQKGDLVVYLEIDAALPIDSPILADFDKSYMTVKKDDATGQEYAVIKTLRLRGALSQGLLLQAKYFPGSVLTEKDVGWNVTEALKVLKYVSPEEAKLYAVTVGQSDDRTTKKLWWRLRAWLTKGIIADGLLPFPRGHVKSDEERVQNCHKLYTEMAEKETTTELSVKFDGESATFYTDLDSGAVGVAQRNYSLRVDDVPYSFGESFRVYLSDWMRFAARRWRGGECDVPKWKKGFVADSVPLVAYFKQKKIAERIMGFNQKPLDFAQGKVLAIQGEMVGPGFNGNAERAKEVEFYIYRAYLNGNLMCSPAQTRQIAKVLGLNYIPVLSENYVLPKDIKDILKMADGPGYFDSKQMQEGVVVKDNNSSRSFKIISNKWLERKAKADTEVMA